VVQDDQRRGRAAEDRRGAVTVRSFCAPAADPRLDRVATLGLLFASSCDELKGNQEVAYEHGSDRETRGFACALDRVWRAISDAEEFGRWFGVRFDGPFVAGAAVGARLSQPPSTTRSPAPRGAHRGEKHLADRRDRTQAAICLPLASIRDRSRYRLRIRADHTRRVHPDGSPDGVLLTIVESGFDAIPASRRSASFEANSEGWAIQTGMVRRYVKTAGMSAQTAVAAPPFRCARGSKPATHHRPALRSGSELDIASHQRHSGHPAGGQPNTCSCWSRPGWSRANRRGRERVWTVQTEPLARASDYLTSCLAGGTRRRTGCGLSWNEGTERLAIGVGAVR